MVGPLLTVPGSSLAEAALGAAAGAFTIRAREDYLTAHAAVTADQDRGYAGGTGPSDRYAGPNQARRAFQNELRSRGYRPDPRHYDEAALNRNRRIRHSFGTSIWARRFGRDFVRAEMPDLGSDITSTITPLPPPPPLPWQQKAPDTSLRTRVHEAMTSLVHGNDTRLFSALRLSDQILALSSAPDLFPHDSYLRVPTSPLPSKP